MDIEWVAYRSPAAPRMSANGSDQLTGWKEIAAYIGKGVRQAQRWEKLGMPVHRVQSMDGVVYAYRAEIDAWRSKASAESLQTAGPAEEEDLSRVLAAVATAADSESVVPGGRRGVVMAAAASVVAALAVVFTLAMQSPERRVATARVERDHVQALDSEGRPMWSFPLGFAAREVRAVAVGSKSVGAPQVFVNDTDRDRREEVLVMVRADTRSTDLMLASDRLLCFSHDGRLRWTFSLPEITFSFGGRRFSGPTRFVAWTHDSAGNTWVAANHHTWWPTVLVRITPKGQPEIRYVQSGAIYALSSWRVGGENYIVAGGVSNEDGLASVAVVDADASPSTSPQTKDSGFDCDDCPAGHPVSFTLIPRSDISLVAKNQPYSYVVALDPTPEGLRLTTYEGEDTVLHHLLSSDLTVTSFPLPDNAAQVHRNMERERRLDHAVEQCPGRREAIRAFTWKPSEGWSANVRRVKPQRAVR